MPVRHVAEIEELDDPEGAAVWSAVSDGVRALKDAYRPDGLNLGANLGRSAGAGIPGHFHLHCIPRWNGDTNFLTTIGGTRVLPESLPQTLERVRTAWPRRALGGRQDRGADRRQAGSVRRTVRTGSRSRPNP